MVARALDKLGGLLASELAFTIALWVLIALLTALLVLIAILIVLVVRKLKNTSRLTYCEYKGRIFTWDARFPQKQPSFQIGVRTDSSFGNELRRLCEARLFSQRELADRLDVSCDLISKIECGKAYPTAALVERIVQALALPEVEALKLWAAFLNDCAETERA